MSEKTWEQLLREIQANFPLLQINLPQLITELFEKPEESLYGIGFNNIKDYLDSFVNHQYDLWKRDFQKQMSFDEYMTIVADELKNIGLVELSKLSTPQTHNEQ